ncbi:MAG: type II toxin-antitoxin system VapC family toxin [Betaproteobacteria bacterium]
MIVLDTNVLSELMKATPADSVMRWVASQPATSLYTTSITQAELLHGIMPLSAGKRRKAFETAAQAMFDEDFVGRILPFGSDAAAHYAQIAAARRRAGQPISHFDAQIAAISHSAGAAVATRNVSDFEGCGVKVINPWEG